MMGFFDKWKKSAINDDINLDEVDAKPYLYLTLNSYGVLRRNSNPSKIPSSSNICLRR